MVTRGDPSASTFSSDIAHAVSRPKDGSIETLEHGRLVQVALKAQLRQRFGASVAEVDGHDKWQRATLLCALVGDGEVAERADGMVRFVECRCPEGCSVDRDLLSLRDIRD